MITQESPSRPLDNPQIPVQVKLAAAWTSFMFLYLYVDYLALYKPGYVENLIAGIVWQFDISQTFVTAAFASVAIPGVMILLSVMLPAKVNRAANLILALLYVPYSVFNAAGESWIYFFGLSIGVEVLILAFIMRTAWTWPRAGASHTVSPSVTGDRLPQQAQA